MFTQIDLSTLAAPDIIETLGFEAIVAQMKAGVIAREPALASLLEIESEPVAKLIEVFAYRELLLRARINDAARAVLLAEARGGDLEHLAALFGVTRLVVFPGDPNAVPPLPEVFETDTALRSRAQLALEGFTTAGPIGSYLFHARSADGRVRDVEVSSPAPGEVRIAVLSAEGDGVASPELLGIVGAAVNDERVRPLCDTVTVVSATNLAFAVAATISTGAGPDPAVIIAASTAAVTALVEASHIIGRPVRLSAIYAALHGPGVEQVVLTAPLADVVPALGQAPFATSVSVTAAP